MESVPSGRLRRGWGAIRSGLDGLATVLVIVVAVTMLYRMAVSSPAPVRAAAKGGAAAARPSIPLPTEPLSLDNAAIKGDPKAKVAVIAYSDFQCPYCGAFARDTWPALQKEYVDTGKIRFAFRHLPLDSLHPKARHIAEAAECARQQGKFWEFHDSLFAHQKELATTNMGKVALDLGLAPQAFGACVKGQAAEHVLGDSRGGEALGVKGTPTFFIGRIEADGRVRVSDLLVGSQSVAAFGKLIVAALGAKP